MIWNLMMRKGKCANLLKTVIRIKQNKKTYMALNLRKYYENVNYLTQGVLDK